MLYPFSALLARMIRGLSDVRGVELFYGNKELQSGVLSVRLAGTDCDLPLPRDARTGAVITVDSFVGRGAHWSYSTLSKAPCLPVAAILYWLADSLAGAERRTLQADPEAARLAAQWQSGTVEMFFHPAVPAAAQLQTQPQTPPVSRPARPAPTCARTKSWQSILAVMASM